MNGWDRFFRAAFVALAVGLGWGIRGDFGHSLGASYPGAALGLAFAFVTGQRSMFRWMPILGALGGLGIAIGGMMSYGILHGYAQSDTLQNYAYGFFTLFLQGGAWGMFGAAPIGLMLERERVAFTEWIGAAVTAALSGFVFYMLVVQTLGFQVNPPRNNISVAFTGAVIGLFAWLALNRKRSGLKAAILGFVGFGLGMSLGRLLGNIANVAQTNPWLPFTINHWNVMEVSVGLIGGFVFAWGMLGREYPEPPRGENVPLLSVYGIFYVMFLIPLMHRLLRIDDERVQTWTNNLISYGYVDASGTVSAIYTALSVLMAAAFVAGLVWLWLHFTDKTRFAWFPVMFFSLVMLLFQNITALYFLYPRTPGQVNMHSVFWVLFGLMALYVVFGKRTPYTEPDEQALDSQWRRWAATAILGYVIIVLAASLVNGPQTMKSANTRWPQWNWREGPFPGREQP